MNSKEDHFFPARLLSKRNSVTVQEKEAVLKAVLDGVEHKRKQSFRERLVSPRGILVAFLGILLLAVPLVFMVLPNGKRTFTPKGKEAPTFFDVRCIADKRPGPCKKGNKIIFKIVPPKNKHYLSVFSKHRSNGTVIWYFPGSEKEGSLEVEKYLRKDTFTRAIEIGDEHAVGTYDVYGIYTDRAVQRHEIRRLIDKKAEEGKPDDKAYIITRTLIVE